MRERGKSVYGLRQVPEAEEVLLQSTSKRSWWPQHENQISSLNPRALFCAFDVTHASLSFSVGFFFFATFFVFLWWSSLWLNGPDACLSDSVFYRLVTRRRHLGTSHSRILASWLTQDHLPACATGVWWCYLHHELASDSQGSTASLATLWGIITISFGNSVQYHQHQVT